MVYIPVKIIKLKSKHMWIYRNFNINGHVVNFLNKNNHLINSVSITTNISQYEHGIRYVVFFRLNAGVEERELNE